MTLRDAGLAFMACFSGIPINKIAETYSFLFFLSFLLAPIFAAIYSTAYT